MILNQPPPLKLLFVCLGNICRSPVAHAVMQDLVQKSNSSHIFSKIDSCGMYGEAEGTPTHPESVSVLQRNGIQFSKPARHFHFEDYEQFDIIFAMDRNNKGDIMRVIKSDTHNKVKLFRDFDPEGQGNVPNPYYQGPDGYDFMYNIIDRTCKKIFDAGMNGGLQ